MKKSIIFLLLLCVTVSAQAQRWTVWYDVNYSNELKGGQLKHWHFANGGVDCTFPVSRWDLTVGAGLNTTGGLLRINYAQLETNAGYRFVDAPSGFSLSALVGPYCGIRVADNHKDWTPFMPEPNRFAFGWQAGIQIGFKPIVLKVGYEQALTAYYDKSITDTMVNADGSPTLPTAKPHSLFIRIGYMF